MTERAIIFTVRVFAEKHETTASELAHVDRALTQAARDARAAGGGKLSGVMLGDGAVPLGEWEYMPSETASPA